MSAALSTSKPLGPRQIALALALAATVAATLWTAQLDEEGADAAAALVAPTARRAMASGPAAAASAPAAADPWGVPAERPPWPEPLQVQLQAWGQPAPPPAPVRTGPPAPPAPPQAPPLPYQLIGRIEADDGRPQAILAGSNGSLLQLRAGDLIDGQWRVEALTPDAVRLLWLPGQQPLTLSFPARP